MGVSPNSMSVIELVDVRVDHPRGGPPLVTGANLTVTGGEVVLIVGAAGVGTSRLVAALLGEHDVAAGRVDVLGRDVGKLRRSSLRLMRRRVGIVPQDLLLIDDRSAQLNVVLPLEIDGVPRGASMGRAAEILARLGLAEEVGVPVAKLSASARQRVAVARALIRDPELVIADHPTSFQDAAGAELVCNALADAASRGAACLLLGRDPALRGIAEGRGWRQLGLMRGALQPLAEIQLDGKLIDDILVAIESAGTAVAHEPEAIPNVVPFPISARTVAGVG
jgi:ABC-type ATPase involved in cell division